MKPTRIPRPLGASNIEDKQRLLIYLVQVYIARGLYIDNKPITLPEFLTLYHITPKDFHNILDKLAKHSGITDKSMASNYRALTSMALNWALSDRHTATNQLALLKESQGDGYKAFVSAEVNKSIGLVQNSTKQFLDLIKTMRPPDAQLNINVNETHITNNQLTINQAHEILAETITTPLLDSPEELQALGAEINVQNLPEIRANYQRGYEPQGARAYNKHEQLDENRAGLDPDDEVILES